MEKNVRDWQEREDCLSSIINQSKVSGQSVRFELSLCEHGDWSSSLVGKVHPCGCIEFNTILSDGSLGWGGWDDLCWKHMHK